MAPVRPAAAAPTIAPAVFLRSNLRVSILSSLDDSSASCLDETDCLRTFGMRHLTGLLFFAGHPPAIPHPGVPACGASYSNRIFPAKLCQVGSRPTPEKITSPGPVTNLLMPNYSHN